MTSVDMWGLRFEWHVGVSLIFGADVTHHLERQEKWTRWAVYAALCLLYLWQRGRHPGFHDSLSYLWDAVSAPSLATNATNHLLYNVTQFLLVKALPFLNPVLILSMVSVTFGMLTLLQVERLAREFTTDPRAALMAVATFGVSFSWWQQTETIEVYSSNAFLFVTFVVYAVRALKVPDPKDLMLAGVILMFALLTHIQNILCLPFYLWLVVRLAIPFQWRIRALLPIAGAALVLLIPPLALDAHPVSAIFFDTQFQKDVMGLDARVLGMGLVKGVAFFGYNFHVWLMGLGMGVLMLWRKERRMALWLSLLLLPFLGFAVKYSVSDNHVFYISVYAVLAAVSASAWQKIFTQRPKWVTGYLIAALLLSPLVYLATTVTVMQLEVGKKLQEEKSYKGGVAHYTWPGRKSCPDPLEAARQWQPTDSVEWNIGPALKYLEWERNRK